LRTVSDEDGSFVAAIDSIRQSLDASGDPSGQDPAWANGFSENPHPPHMVTPSQLQKGCEHASVEPWQ
jgi:hypothetical protein